ncbi:MAG: indole-3-glycerol phosphate synthase TrpC [Chitinophagaceae bacterium]|nr:indole-3-glycerol phosphate synthase TrpC [Chitinophagaceae bacterium]
MNILEKIIESKKEEVATNKQFISSDQLMQHPFFARTTFSLKQFLRDENKTGIIAEFKRQSPSKGIINNKADVVEVTKAYSDNGAAGLSVLTDTKFFGGHADDLIKARVNHIPILRKDFIIDTYQLIEVKAMGADVILLIAACLSPESVQELAFFAKSLGLEVLLEIHVEDELVHICDEVDIIGINNRNLKTFEVDINRSIELSRKIPADKTKMAESGIDNVETIKIFKEAGFSGFLMGEKFMKAENPGEAFEQFVQQLKKG